jgi:hypothetical protein
MAETGSAGAFEADAADVADAVMDVATGVAMEEVKRETTGASGARNRGFPGHRSRVLLLRSLLVLRSQAGLSLDRRRDTNRYCFRGNRFPSIAVWLSQRSSTSAFPRMSGLKRAPAQPPPRLQHPRLPWQRLFRTMNPSSLVLVPVPIPALLRLPKYLISK